LQAGRAYSVSLYLYAPGSQFVSDYFGIHISDVIYRSTKDTVLQIDESISVKEKQVRKLKNGWNEIKLSFIATGKERYLLMGNFAKTSNKEILERSGRNLKHLEYYVDNLSVKPLDKTEMNCFDYKQRLDSLFASNRRHDIFQRERIVSSDSVKRDIAFTPQTDTILLSQINFSFDSDVLLNTTLIEKYFSGINISTISKIQVIGYTDSIGNKSYNLDLSERRALSVRRFLIDAFKFSKTLVLAEGRGISKDKHLMEENRRVELIIYKTE
jgi:outer membrane protein OmpA-like peptidoglycan-associated protein